MNWRNFALLAVLEIMWGVLATTLHANPVVRFGVCAAIAALVPPIWVRR